MSWPPDAWPAEYPLGGVVTPSGVLHDLRDPESAWGLITSDDVSTVAHRMCRWRGALAADLLTHSAWCALRARALFGEETGRYAGAHDLHETVVGDIPAPIKALMPDFEALEERWAAVFHAGLALEWPPPAEIAANVHAVDLEARSVEIAAWARPEHPLWRRAPPSHSMRTLGTMLLQLSLAPSGRAWEYVVRPPMRYDIQRIPLGAP